MKTGVLALHRLMLERGIAFFWEESRHFNTNRVVVNSAMTIAVDLGARHTFEGGGKCNPKYWRLPEYIFKYDNAAVIMRK
jgi:hypothetical protein